jgi:Tfp pilus assembly protein FimT
MPAIARVVPLLPALLLSLLAPLLGGCGATTPRYTEDRSMTVPHRPGTPVAVVNANGSVTVESHAGPDVRIEARLASDSPERLAFARLNAAREGDERLRVWVEWPGGDRRGNEGASIRVYLPDADGVDIRTSNGSVRVAGLAGTADIATSNGSIVVQDHAGRVRGRTTNGTLRAENTVRSVELFSSNGAATILNAGGPVRVETTNGSVRVTTTPDNAGPVRLRTTNGSVSLDLGPAFAGRLRLGTSGDRISVQGFGGARMIESRGDTVEMQVGDDETISAVRTTNGSVRVRGPEPSGVR